MKIPVALRKEIAYFRIKIFDENPDYSKSINQGG